MVKFNVTDFNATLEDSIVGPIPKETSVLYIESSGFTSNRCTKKLGDPYRFERIGKDGLPVVVWKAVSRNSTLSPIEDITPEIDASNGAIVWVVAHIEDEHYRGHKRFIELGNALAEALSR